MITALLERFARWLERTSCTFELDGPVTVQDRGSWLRIAPGEPPSWWPTDWQALSV